MLRYIDLGGEGKGGLESRVWMLDPLDGTAAFMSGNQYAVCVALVEDGEQKMGVIGCPNLPFDNVHLQEAIVDSDGYGCLLSAVKGQGAFVRKMEADRLGPPRKVSHGKREVIRIVKPFPLLMGRLPPSSILVSCKQLNFMSVAQPVPSRKRKQSSQEACEVDNSPFLSRKRKKSR